VHLTRRQLLAAGVGGGAAALMGNSGRALARTAASIAPAGHDLGAVEHVVFLTMENRSFDHYFGSMSGVKGFDDINNRAAFSQPWPGGRDATLLPYHLDSTHPGGECIEDLSHTWPAQHSSWNGGLMDQFVATHLESQVNGPGGVFTMGYHTRQDLTFHYPLADAFTVCDNYFCSVLGPTHPNRLFALSGTNDPDGVAGGPVLTTNVSRNAIFSASWPTMPEALSNAGVSWKVYNPTGPAYRPSDPSALLLSDNILLYFKQYANKASSLYQNAFLPTIPHFAQDVRKGTLPNVSWIIPRVGYDEHPPSASLIGEWFTHQIISALTANPAVWARTVLFITFDENDGLFDHVPPPTPPPGTPGEYVTVNPLPVEAGGFSGPVGLGVRVPMLVVSPFSRGGFVCSDTFDHTSMLRFLETRFGVTVPNVSAWRRGVTGDLTATVQAAANMSKLHLPHTAGIFDPRMHEGCPAGPQGAVIPNPQFMPTQESITTYPRHPTPT